MLKDELMKMSKEKEKMVKERDELKQKIEVIDNKKDELLIEHYKRNEDKIKNITRKTENISKIDRDSRQCINDAVFLFKNIFYPLSSKRIETNVNLGETLDDEYMEKYIIVLSDKIMSKDDTYERNRASEISPEELKKILLLSGNKLAKYLPDYKRIRYIKFLDIVRDIAVMKGDFYKDLNTEIIRENLKEIKIKGIRLDSCNKKVSLDEDGGDRSSGYNELDIHLSAIGIEEWILVEQVYDFIDKMIDEVIIKLNRILEINKKVVEDIKKEFGKDLMAKEV